MELWDTQMQRRPAGEKARWRWRDWNCEPQANESLELPEAEKRKVPLEPSRGRVDVPIPWLQNSGLWETMRKWISVVLSYLVCGHLLWKPWETNTTTKLQVKNGPVEWANSRYTDTVQRCVLTHWLGQEASQLSKSLSLDQSWLGQPQPWMRPS